MDLLSQYGGGSMNKNNMNSNVLQFYGGEWMSFFPFLIFLVLIIITTFLWGPFQMARSGFRHF